MRSFILLLLGIAATHAGCAARFDQSLSQTYEPLGPITSSAQIDTLYVLPTTDVREEKDKTTVFSGLIAFVPFVPSGYQQGNPDVYLAGPGKFSHDFKSDVTETVVNDLAAAKIARNVVQLDAETPVPDLKADDRILRIEMRQAVWRRNFRLYGLSVWGASAWLFAPISKGSVDLELHVQLEDSHGRTIAEQVLSGSESVTEWIYKPTPRFEPYSLAYGQLSPDLRMMTRTPPDTTIQQAGFESPLDRE